MACSALCSGLSSGSDAPFFCVLKINAKMNTKKEATSTVVAKINGVSIVVIGNGEKRVPVKPICEALGIAFEPQFTRLKDDPILSSVVMLSVTTGSDGKQYEMVTIPFMYVFGWLFRIDSRNVKEEAREAVLRYQVECYKALYNHFTRYSEFVEWQSALIEEQLVIVDNRKKVFHETKEALLDAENELKRRRQLTIDDFIAERAQLKLDFKEE
jgi:hypothetical protein